jgi:branched-chain amino acid transport system permease protein
VLTILLDGIAYGMLLFVIASGLSITLGLMNFINLAHGVFAMAGGYAAAALMNKAGVSFFAALPLAFLASALAGLVLERLLYRHVYTRSHLDQVLFTIGLVFMAVAGTDYAMGSTEQVIRLPEILRGRTELLGANIGNYRLFVIVVCGLLAFSVQWLMVRTRFGSRLRAAVDDPRVARGLGIEVSVIFAVTFAIGSGLAGLGGALGAEILGMNPRFPVTYLIYFLIVVTVGGTTGVTGTFFAALLLGIADVAGKYYMPQVGAFVIYAVMVIVLILRPQGLFARPGGR